MKTTKIRDVQLLPRGMHVEHGVEVSNFRVYRGIVNE